MRGAERALFRHLNRIVAAAAGIAALLAGAYFWQQANIEDDFQALAAQGRGALSRVESTRDLGRRHLRPGEDYTYSEQFPASGPHAQVWTKAGFYEAPQADTLIVHAAEHGNVVVHYDRLSSEDLSLLRDWASLYSGQWDGIVVVPAPGLGERLKLVAWNKRLTLERFEPAPIAAFIDAYRGRGPENPVR